MPTLVNGLMDGCSRSMHLMLPKVLLELGEDLDHSILKNTELFETVATPASTISFSI